MKLAFRRVVPLLLSVSSLLVLAGCASRAAMEAPPEPVAAPPAVSMTPVEPPPPAAEPEPVAPVAPAVSLDFDPAFFRFDSSMLDAPAREALDITARLLREKPSMRITIEGHCDERGAAEYNLALGERRALAARDYLVASGISRDRIQVVSYGKERPFSNGHDESAWAVNRRAHVTVRTAGTTGSLSSGDSR